MVKPKMVLILGIICLIIGGLLSDGMLKALIELLPKGITFIATAPTDGFMLLMWVTLIIAIGLFGILLSGLWWLEYKDIFYKREKDFVLTHFAPATLMFVVGTIFGILLYTQIMLPFFLKTNTGIGLTNLLNLNSVLITGIKLSLLLGLCFELPIILRGLIGFGLIKKEVLKGNRLKVLFAIMVASAIITPTPDVLSMGIVALPLYGLFEVSLI